MLPEPITHPRTRSLRLRSLRLRSGQAGQAGQVREDGAPGRALCGTAARLKSCPDKSCRDESSPDETLRDQEKK